MITVDSKRDIQRVADVVGRQINPPQSQVAFPHFNVYAVRVTANESAGNPVVAIEPTVRGSETETPQGVRCANGAASVFNVRIFERAVGSFHVVHAAGQKFSLE